MLDVTPIPAFDDNYIWLLRQGDSPLCAVVDPGDEDPVLERLDKNGLQLAAILITHKHWDHTGGVEALRDAFPQARVFGPAAEKIAGLSDALDGGERIEIPGLAAFEVLSVPGHTEGHLAYYGEGCLFCGDTLFAAGCGRVFTGTFEQLAESLRRIRALPADTRCYCAHEYTLANLGFAKWVEPDSEPLAARERYEQQRREYGEATVPFELAGELAVNPFLRTDQPTVIAAAEKWAGQPLADETAVFRALRTWKDKDYD